MFLVRYCTEVRVLPGCFISLNVFLQPERKVSVLWVWEKCVMGMGKKSSPRQQTVTLTVLLAVVLREQSEHNKGFHNTN